jgi:hypothetical protein
MKKKLIKPKDEWEMYVNNQDITFWKILLKKIK